MKTLFAQILLCAALLHGTCLPIQAGTLVPQDLRCEYLSDPLGIDTPQPRLSWRSEASAADARGQRQTAYQILVAASEKALSSDRGDLWDTGKVASDQSLHVSYAGRPLPSEQACWWKVRVWDQDGQASDWSAPARWTMGLLQPGDWRAQWIGREEPPAPASANVLVSAGAQWIGFPGENAGAAAPIGTRYFRRTFELPADRKISRGELILAADNEFATAVNGTHAGAGSNFRAGVVMDVTKSLQAGRNLVAAWVKNVGDSPNPAGLVGVLRVEFESGAPIVIATDAQWRDLRPRCGSVDGVGGRRQRVARRGSGRTCRRWTVG